MPLNITRGKISVVSKELVIWHFVRDRLVQSQPVILLVVAESTGSSPGRQGYKMAVGLDGELVGSIGGGVMEVRLVEYAKAGLSVPGVVTTGHLTTESTEQVHQKNAANASGMICSGKQTVIFKRLDRDDLATVKSIIGALENREPRQLTISPPAFRTGPPQGGTQIDNYRFEKLSDSQFVFTEKLGKKNDLYIIGGGHCSLALSELMSRMDFHIHILDDRPELNTIEKNHYADEITIIGGYDEIGARIPSGSNIYVVVMTLGYASDEIVIRRLVDHDPKYFGVLGSKAKMKILLTSLERDGVPRSRLDRIHTPVGLAINSRTPDEIAVSIAAEIISVKNAD